MTTMTQTQIDSAEQTKLALPTRLAVAALTLGWLFDWAFFDKPLGINFAIYVALLVATLLGASLFEQAKPQRGSWLILLPTAFFAVMVAIRANPFITFLNVCAVLLLLMLYVYFFAGGKLVAQRTLDYFMVKPLFVMSWSLLNTFGLLRDVRREQRERENQSTLLPILRGLLLALPILLIFGALLLSADLIFAQRVESLIELPSFSEIIIRMMLIAFVAWVVAGAMVYALTREELELSAEQQDKVGATPLPLKLSLGFIESTIVLNLVNLLFAAFVVVQFGYLFGGAQNVNLEGFTYAEYARRGFFELVAVAVLALMLLLTLKTLTKRNNATQSLVHNLSSSVMVFCVTVMLISAYRRLRLYELTFGFTQDRVLPHVFMIWLGLALGWFIFTLWRKPNLFAIGLLVCCLGYVATLNVMNIDAFIVRQNWARYQLIGGEVQVHYRQVVENPGLDLSYLMLLSADAMPELAAIVNELPVEPTLIEQFNYERSDYETVENESARAILQDTLDRRTNDATERFDESPWQSYHMAYARVTTLQGK